MYIRPYRNGFRCEVQIGAARKTKTFKSEREARRWGRDMEAELAAKAQPGGRAFALTMYSRRMDIMTLARISRHRDLSLLQNTYYREDAADIAARV